ncbi:MAG: TetR/AcrR family transcriptional regulator [Alphaproteobacteria bacterium]|nr:TetR/AcrR family transcriptional regulator [Alphaproteobacteria bacterium]
MARRSDHTREELKNRILEVSWKIVQKDGLAGLTARRIAKEIGYTPGTIYNIFNSMDDLYLTVNGLTLDRLHEILSSPECNNPKKSSIQNMKKMAELYREFSNKHRPHWLMLFTHALPEEKLAPEWYQEKISRLFEPLEKLLEPFYLKKSPHKRKMAARVLWASVHGLCFLEGTGKIPLISNQTTTNMTDYLIDSFITGIKNEG